MYCLQITHVGDNTTHTYHFHLLDNAKVVANRLTYCTLQFEADRYGGYHAYGRNGNCDEYSASIEPIFFMDGPMDGE